MTINERDDLARTVSCSVCQASPGEACVSPKSGRRAHGPHQARKALAIAESTSATPEVAVEPVEVETNIDVPATVKNNEIPEQREELERLNLAELVYTIACPLCGAAPDASCETLSGTKAKSTHKARSTSLMKVYEAGVSDGFNFESYLDGYADGKALRESKLSKQPR